MEKDRSKWTSLYLAKENMPADIFWSSWRYETVIDNSKLQQYKVGKAKIYCWPADLLQYESSKENISTLTTNGYFALILHFKFYI